MKSIVVTLMLVSFSAAASDFSARVAAGNKAMATPEGKVYDAALAPAIQSVMLVCVPPGLPANMSAGKFVLVGYANASGHLSAVAIEPVTKVSRCFAEKFGATQLPVPPSGHWGNAYPVTIEMTVAL